MPSNWPTALPKELQLKTALIPAYRDEHHLQMRDVGGLVVRCGAATGRLGYFLDWSEAHEDR